MQDVSRLLGELEDSVQVTRAPASGMLKIQFSWTSGDLDLPEVCNYLVRKFRIPVVTVLTRPRSGDVKSAALRLSGIDNDILDVVRAEMMNDRAGLADAIVAGGLIKPYGAQ